MKILLALTVLFGSLSAFAGPAMCGKFTAVVAASGEKVTITSQVSEYVREPEYTGYGTIITNVEGKNGLKVSCNLFFTGDTDSKICDIIAVKKLVKINTDDCWVE